MTHSPTDGLSDRQRATARDSTGQTNEYRYRWLLRRTIGLEPSRRSKPVIGWLVGRGDQLSACQVLFTRISRRRRGALNPRRASVRPVAVVSVHRRTPTPTHKQRQLSGLFLGRAGQASHAYITSLLPLACIWTRILVTSEVDRGCPRNTPACIHPGCV